MDGFKDFSTFVFPAYKVMMATLCMYSFPLRMHLMHRRWTCQNFHLSVHERAAQHQGSRVIPEQVLKPNRECQTVWPILLIFPLSSQLSFLLCVPKPCCYWPDTLSTFLFNMDGFDHLVIIVIGWIEQRDDSPLVSTLGSSHPNQQNSSCNVTHEAMTVGRCDLNTT